MSIEKDVVFNAVNGRALKLDLYRPEAGAAATGTAVLLVHGGGWALGQRGMMEPLASALAARGFLAIDVEYRLLGEAPWPAQLDDVLAAVRWTADNAEQLGLRADRIVLAGSSAGGHLVMMAAATLGKSQVAAVIANFAPGELVVEPDPAKGQVAAAKLLGDGATPAAARAASPAHHITADFPPVFLLHGNADWLLDPIASLRVYERLVELGVPAELHIVAAAHHEFVVEPGMAAPMAAEMALFLDRMLIDPQRWKAESLASNFFAKGRPPA